MIAYPVSTRVIERLARKRAPDWQVKANSRTLDHQRQRRYIPKTETLPNGRRATEFWNEVKSVFVTAQYGKCAYCEMKLEVGRQAAIEWDLEHFRPKAEVEEWTYHFATGSPMAGGYYLLAYHLGNYLASCKICNTILKRTYFPIQQARVSHGATPSDHIPEGAYLIYPLGDSAEDPQDYIEFHGVEARAKNGSVRGQLLKDFFDLDREGLQRSRAEWLVNTFWSTFKLAVQNDPEAINTMQWMLSCEAPHSNCTRCFYELCLTSRPQAEVLHEQMKRILKKSPTL